MGVTMRGEPTVYWGTKELSVPVPPALQVQCAPEDELRIEPPIHGAGPPLVRENGVAHGLPAATLDVGRDAGLLHELERLVAVLGQRHKWGQATFARRSHRSCWH